MRKFMLAVPIAAVVMGILVVANDKVEQYKCGNFSAVTGYTTKYVPMGKCYIETAGGPVWLDEYLLWKSRSEGLRYEGARY
jgi:hypothetical protein